MSDIKFVVRVECMTYNQAPYIEDALNGFTKQQTSFPFICTIMDDASTDGEPEVIKKYLNDHFDLADKSIVRWEETEDFTLIFVRHNTNLNCYFAVFLLKYNHYRKKDKASYLREWAEIKYIAFCEGDDYWLDPLKLHKQVEFLETRREYGMCYTWSRVYIHNTGKYSDYIAGIESPESFKDMLLLEPPITLTSLLRSDLYRQYYHEIKPQKRAWLMGDTPLWLWFAANSKIKVLREITAVYRELPNSASHSNDVESLKKFNLSAREIRIFFCDKYPKLGAHLKQEVYRAYYRNNMMYAYRLSNLSWYFQNLLNIGFTKIKKRDMKLLFRLLQNKWASSLSV